MENERKPAWKVTINGKGSSAIFMAPVTAKMVQKYLEKRFPKYEIKVLY